MRWFREVDLGVWHCRFWAGSFPAWLRRLSGFGEGDGTFDSSPYSARAQHLDANSRCKSAYYFLDHSSSSKDDLRIKCIDFLVSLRYETDPTGKYL